MSSPTWGCRTLPNSAQKPASARPSAPIVRKRRLSQAELSAALGVNQPKVSALLHFKLEGFSVERLMGFQAALGNDVEIIVKSKPRSRPARVAVKAA